MRHIKLLFLSLAAMLAATSVSAQKVVGGDISMLPRYEQKGAQYLDHDGNAISDVLSFFADKRLNAMRVRIFVNPANASESDQKGGVVQDLDYVKSLAKRIKDAGFRLLLDFHYSDTWADPSNQWTPADWQDLDDSQLGQKLYEYTKETLSALKAYGTTPDYIQTGNEISYGMLWGKSGSTANRCYINSSDANWNRFTSLLSQAVKACREVCPDASVILHSERSGDQKVLLDFMSRMEKAGVSYDILGLSYYPAYHGSLATLDQTLSAVASAYPDRKVMIVETGYPAHWALNGTKYDFSSTYPYSDAGQKKLTDDLITTLNKHASVTGLFWWWPEANEHGVNWQNAVTSSWYNGTLFDNETGKAYSALDDLSLFRNNDVDAIQNINVPASHGLWYTLQGTVVNHPSLPGIYVHNGKKVVIR